MRIYVLTNRQFDGTAACEYPQRRTMAYKRVYFIRTSLLRGVAAERKPISDI